MNQFCGRPQAKAKKEHFFAAVITCLTLGFIAQAAAPLAAATITWTGNTNNDWEEMNNWSPSMVPMSGDTAVFNDLMMGPVTINTLADSAQELHFTGGDYSLLGAGTFTFAGGNGLIQIDMGAGTQNLKNDSNASTITLGNVSLEIRNASSNPFGMGPPIGTGDLTISQGEALMFAGVFVSETLTGTIAIASGASWGLDPASSGSAHFTFEGLSGSGQFINPGAVGSVITVNTPLNSTVEFSGSVTDPIEFVKTGPGTQILSGISSFGIVAPTLGGGTLSAPSIQNLGITMGSLLINNTSGTVTLQATGTLSGSGSSVLTIDNAGTKLIEVSSSSTLNIASPIATGGGPLGIVRKTGGGTLLFTALNPMYVNQTEIDAGRLNVTGTSAGPTNVNSGGILGGTGTINAAVTVNSQGILAPGASIGTLTVSSLTLEPGSITQIEISPSAASEIVSNGAAALNGSVQVIAQPGDYGASGQLLILASGVPYTGSFSSVSGNLPGYTFTLSQPAGATEVFLNWFLSPASLIPTTGLTGSADAFARYLNQNVPSSSATLALAALSGTTLQNALESANPSRNAFAPFAAQNTMFAWNQLLAGHLVDQRFYHAQKEADRSVASLFNKESDLFTADVSGRMVLPRACETHSFWVGALGEYAHQGALDQNPAFHYWAGGGILGADFYNDRNLFGFGAGGAYTRVFENHDAGKVAIASYFATVYDTFYGFADFPFYYELGLWGVYNQIHNERHIFFPGTDRTASASFRGWQLVPHLGLGYHADCGCFSFDPFAQFDLALDWQQGFQEKGAGAFNMTQSSRNAQFLRSEGGFRFYQMQRTSWGSWMMMEKASYVNKKTFGTGSVAASIVGTSALFSVETFRNTQNLGSAGLEFLCRWGETNPFTFSVQFNGEYGSQYWAQEGTVRLLKDF